MVLREGGKQGGFGSFLAGWGAVLAWRGAVVLLHLEVLFLFHIFAWKPCHFKVITVWREGVIFPSRKVLTFIYVLKQDNWLMGTPCASSFLLQSTFSSKTGQVVAMTFFTLTFADSLGIWSSVQEWKKSFFTPVSPWTKKKYIKKKYTKLHMY